MRKINHALMVLLFLALPNLLHATKLVWVKVVDKDYIQVFFKDGEVVFVDDGLGTCAFTGCVEADDNELISYGTELDTVNAVSTANWIITSAGDANYTTAQSPIAVYRKSKLTGMSQEEWSGSDYEYDWAYEHSIFLQLPSSLKQGSTYTIEINANTNTDVTSQDITYDIFNSRSEAVKINLNGYSTTESVKAVDLYMWMGDGGIRDYSSLEGNKVYVYDTVSGTSYEVGTVQFWQNSIYETIYHHEMVRSDVWNADISAFNTPGVYRVAIEGVGCSEDFVISEDVYRTPHQVSVLGFYYMRIGEDGTGMTPIPRRPLFIPEVSPTDCKVYITTMHPYHAEWSTFSSGDPWDHEDDWVPYVKAGNPTNPNAYGGHSDALDWDRHLGHVSIVYDMLLPYIVTGGGLADDDLGIPESGNGIPDILDEARNEVDFWLRLRDGMGYSHGITNPDGSNALYQAGTTTIAAWANAANAAMLANCFQLAGLTTLMEEYRDSAVIAYNYASGLTDQMLTSILNVGNSTMSGSDLKMTAAAYLYNITGNTAYEDVINSESRVTSTTSMFNNAGISNSFNQTYAIAGYLFTPQTVNYQALYDNMKASVIYQAKQREANYTLSRPSRRGSDHYIGWFVTEIGVQRCIIAHAISEEGADKDMFLDALVLEADWSLGRNPLNMIYMTTATTALGNKRSVENAYTSGWNDGTPGVHPGHTPYMNIYNFSNMVMGRPEWMREKNYPDYTEWPYGEMCYNTRYVYAHSEFTPQQTMGGKQALYGYLYASDAKYDPCKSPNLGTDKSICLDTITLNSGVFNTDATYVWEKDGTTLTGEDALTCKVTRPGTYTVTVSITGCSSASDEITISSGAPIINLGDNKTIKEGETITLDAGITGDSITYAWEKDGVLLPNDTLATLEVTKAGTYSVTVTVTGCIPATDEIVISPKSAITVGNYGTIIPNPLISRDKPTYTNGTNGSTRNVTDGDYNTYVSMAASEVSSSNPLYIAINIGDNTASRVLLKWEDQYSWNYWRADGGAPGDYTIEVSSNSTDGTDGDWNTVATVTGNLYPLRSHSFNFSGYTWVRMSITSIASTSVALRIAQIDVHDVTEGLDDHWMLLGDSFTAHAVDRAQVDTIYSDLIAKFRPNYFPCVIGAGHGGFTSQDVLDRIDAVLEDNPDVKFYAICLGINDAAAMDTAQFHSNMRQIVEKIIDAGGIPVLSRTPYGWGISHDDHDDYATVCDNLTAEYNLITGPDFYNFYKDNAATHMLSDGLHPSEAGERAFHDLWAEAMIAAGLYDESEISISDFEASPSSIQNDVSNTVEFSAQVTTKQNQVSSVIIDLSELGGSATETMSAIDSIYTASIIVPVDFAEGTKTITITAEDDHGNIATRKTYVEITGITGVIADMDQLQGKELIFTPLSSGKVVMDVYNLNGQHILSHTEVAYTGQKLDFKSILGSYTMLEGLFILRINGAGINYNNLYFK